MHPMAKIVFECPPNETIVSMCGYRDEVLLATDINLYSIRYDFLSDEYYAEKIEDKEKV